VGNTRREDNSSGVATEQKEEEGELETFARETARLEYIWVCINNYYWCFVTTDRVREEKNM